MMGMMNKIKETQAKVEETRKRLDSVMLMEKSNDELLQVKISANRELKSIQISDELLEDKEQLEDYLILTLNKAIKQAGEVNDSEVSAVAKEGMPDIPGLTS